MGISSITSPALSESGLINGYKWEFDCKSWNNVSSIVLIPSSPLTTDTKTLLNEIKRTCPILVYAPWPSNYYSWENDPVVEVIIEKARETFKDKPILLLLPNYSF